MTELYKNIYQIDLPLPNSPLKILNCFVIKGEDRNLIVDTGFNKDETYKALLEGLEELGISMENTDVFLTHLHADHSGLSAKLKHDNNKVYISEVDGKRVNGFLTDEYWDNILKLHELMGFPEDMKLHYSDHPGYINRPDRQLDFTYVDDGDTIKVGEFEFTCIDLSGHTPAQLGLYEKNHKLMFSGDHILYRISPNINMWGFEQDYLGNYIKNLKKVCDMDIEKLFSAHRLLMDDYRARVDELLVHHENRLDIIVKLLDDGCRTVFDVTKNMKWDFGTGNFLDFPPPQRWFASSEIFAHLEHLVRLSKITKHEENGTIFYCPL